MFKRTFTALAAVVIALAVPQASIARTAPETGYAAVNGLNMYYEIHGSGPPVVLLHGAFATIDLWPDMIAALSATHQVIAIEQQGHGHTADIDRPLSHEQMADDTAALLHQLGIANADFLGYSMGATTALAMAIRHPEMVRKLVLISTAFSPNGYPPELLAGIEMMRAEDFIGSPPHDAYLRTAPNPAAWPTLVARVQDLERTFAGWTPETVAAITAPTLIIVGDSDAIVLEHAVELFRLLGGGVIADYVGLPASQLAILPGTSHVGMVVERAPWLAMMALPFLDAPMPGG